MSFIMAQTFELENVFKFYFPSKFLLGINESAYIPTSQAKSILVTISPALALKNLE